MTADQNKGISFSIKRIKDIAFYTNENLYIPDESKQIKVGFIPTLGFQEEENLVVLIIKVFYHYQDAEPLPENILLEIQVQNIFEVPQLKVV